MNHSVHTHGMDMAPPPSSLSTTMNNATGGVRDDDDERPPGWPGYNNLGMYILALVVVLFIAILVEFLSHSKYIKEDADNVTAGLLQTTLYGLRIGLAYVVMLAVMSFNAGVFLVAIVGHRGRTSLQGVQPNPPSTEKYTIYS
ncbi:hypothetical protein P3S67_011001 [Capsicum chacoense]